MKTHPKSKSEINMLVKSARDTSTRIFTILNSYYSGSKHEDPKALKTLRHLQEKRLQKIFELDDAINH